eukprot:TRINITY_DN13787_c0_g1_i2.p1 TRINITY_DN13787_c0_g1~~TRINITY_DN13787_c0_g1_i2.p1  ORF type:complete len:141 (+),score=1.31 TRINITY_DN13787_c0_g1_i2:128-550(+)
MIKYYNFAKYFEMLQRELTDLRRPTPCAFFPSLERKSQLLVTYGVSFFKNKGKLLPLGTKLMSSSASTPAGPSDHASTYPNLVAAIDGEHYNIFDGKSAKIEPLDFNAKIPLSLIPFTLDSSAIRVPRNFAPALLRTSGS